MCKMPVAQKEKVGEMFLYAILNMTPSELELLVEYLTQAVETRQQSA